MGPLWMGLQIMIHPKLQLERTCFLLSPARCAPLTPQDSCPPELCPQAGS